MEIRTLTPAYAVSGQIGPGDAAALREAGFTDVICNRPDAEIDADEASDAMRRAVEAEGLRFHYNPVTNGALTTENVAAQGRVTAVASGPVFAYCRSGMRSSVVWALSEAGRDGADAGSLVATAASAGYDLAPLRAQIEAVAKAR